jgi:hypothetical protein
MRSAVAWEPRQRFMRLQPAAKPLEEVALARTMAVAVPSLAISSVFCAM